MRITNRLGLPEAIVNAVRNDGYTKGGADASVTELIGPPRIATLKRQHGDSLEEDASERIWSLMGQSIHAILERANSTGIAERRLSVTIEGWRISGGMDLVSVGRTLSDYKVTSVYQIKDGVKPEFVAQLNSYAHILRANGEAIEALEIVAILRDWSKMEASRDPYYPQSQVVRMEVPMWAPEKAGAYLRERVILHQQARLALPECTPEERWARPDRWAVMKEGRKSAVRVYDTEGEATAHVGFDKALSVVYRPGESVRCRFYCGAAKFCQQAQSARPSEESDSQPQAVGE